MKRNDLLILIAIWEFITAAGAFIGIVAIAVFAFPDAASGWRGADVGALFGLSIATILLLGFLGLAVAAGIGITSGKEWGRICGIVHAAVSLVRIPFGTIAGILALIYLTRPKTREFFEPPKE